MLPKWQLTTVLSIATAITSVQSAADNGQQNIHDLGKQTWTVTNEYGNITVPGKFPSHVHLDLHEAGVISE